MLSHDKHMYKHEWYIEAIPPSCCVHSYCLTLQTCNTKPSCCVHSYCLTLQTCNTLIIYIWELSIMQYYYIKWYIIKFHCDPIRLCTVHSNCKWSMLHHQYNPTLLFMETLYDVPLYLSSGLL